MDGRDGGYWREIVGSIGHFCYKFSLSRLRCVSCCTIFRICWTFCFLREKTRLILRM